MLWLLLAVPAVVGGALLVAGHPVDRWAALVGVAAATGTAALGVVVTVTRPAVEVPWLAAAPVGLAVDGLSAAVVLTVVGVLVAVLVSRAGQMAGGPGSSPARFHGLMLVFGAAVLLTATATTLPPLLAGWEVMGATSYALIGFAWRSPVKGAAGTTAFLTTRTADLGLYAAAGAALAGGATLRLTDLATARGGWLDVLTAGIVVAALGKAAQLPFSFWLSRAMEGPSQVSALLHSAAMVAMGGYLLLRLSPVLAASGWGSTTVAWVGVVTAVVLGLVALAQTDLKQLLAASTAAQLGFVVLAAGVGGVAAGRDQLVAHAATKALLFLAAGAWLSALGTKRLRALTGAGRLYPLVGVAFTVGALSLAGLPPLSLWAAKESVLTAALGRSLPLYLVGLLAAFLSAAYAGRALVFVLRAPDPTASYDDEQLGSRQVGLLERLPLVVLAAAAAVLGVIALPLSAGAPELAASVAVVLAGLGLAWRWPELPLPAVVGRWLDLEPLAHSLVVRPVLELSAALAAVDDRVLAPAVVGVAPAGQRLAAQARRVDDGGLAAGIARITAGVRDLGRLARLPQTGQLHTYYAQAAVVLAGAVALVVLAR